ncbi:MAG: NMT1-like family [Chloroflexi bacterium]|nr:NMT1-like family [Chloroflexota bacterium]
MKARTSSWFGPRSRIWARSSTCSSLAVRSRGRGIDGSHKEQWDLLQEGTGDAATLGAPWWIFAAKAGYRNAGHEQNYTLSASGMGLYTRPNQIEKNPNLVRGFVRAYVRSMRYCAENVEGTVGAMMKFARDWGVDSYDIGLAAYEDVAPYWKVEIDVPRLGEVLAKTTERNGLSPVTADEIFDSRFLREALES